MNHDFIQNALGRTENGQKWLDSIPELIAKYEEKWQIQVGEPFALSYNYVAPAVDSNGTRCVIKIGTPEDAEFRTEIAALQVFNGRGMVALLQNSEVDPVILLEHVVPGKMLADVTDDADATKILAGVIKILRRPIHDNSIFPTLTDLALAFDRYHNSGKDQIPSDLVQTAKHLFDHLINTSSELVLCHGDLHHDNILTSDRAGWLAIDPKGIAAEPEYEVAAMIRNPHQRLSQIHDLKPLLESRIAILAAELQHDPHRLLQWCFAQTVLSAIWSIEDGANEPEHEIRVAQALQKMLS